MDEAYKLAAASSGRSGREIPRAGWIAGLTAWKEGKYAEAAKHFERTATSPRASAWMSAAGAYWTARCYLRDRQPAQDHVAERTPYARGPGCVDGYAADRRMPGQQAGQQVELVLAAAALERREVRRDFLQAQHIEVGQRLRVFDDAPRVDTAVDAAAPLDVPGDQFQNKPSRNSKKRQGGQS